MPLSLLWEGSLSISPQLPKHFHQALGNSHSSSAKPLCHQLPLKGSFPFCFNHFSSRDTGLSASPTVTSPGGVSALGADIADPGATHMHFLMLFCPTVVLSISLAELIFSDFIMQAVDPLPLPCSSSGHCHHWEFQCHYYLLGPPVNPKFPFPISQHPVSLFLPGTYSMANH